LQQLGAGDASALCHFIASLVEIELAQAVDSVTNRLFPAACERNIAMRILLVIACALPSVPSLAGGVKDGKAFVSATFQAQIEDLKKGTYCSALSCEFGIEKVVATESGPKSYDIAATAWLKGTIPKLHGSTKRTVSLTGAYSRGSCVVKDLKVVSDNTENNNGWGATGIGKLFKQIPIPRELKLSKTDCDRVDDYLFNS
jgi:hypothetical protein